jgi:hypothetical protein
MANVLERALDPRVTPRRILGRHPHDELPDFEKYPAPTSFSSVRPLPRNQLAMPSQQRVGRRDGRDLPQGRAAHPVCPRRQPSAIVVGQTQPTPAKLATQEPVFFDEVGDRPLLPALQPASQHTQDHLQRCGVEHEPELISRAGLKDVGRVLEHFYEAARQVTRLLVTFFGDRRQTSSERARPLNQPGDVRANGFAVLPHRQAHDLARSFTLLCALCVARHRAGARYDPTEASRTLRDGSQ